MENMEKINLKNMSVEGAIQGDNTQEAKEILKGYDLYYMMIEDGGQWKKAKRNNEDILREVKNLGITKLKVEFMGTYTDLI